MPLPNTPTRRALDPSHAIALLREQSLTSAVHDELERRILAGEFVAGTRLNEAALAAALGTSRGPLREAFRALDQAGLVRVAKNRGVFVREVSLDEAAEYYEVRAALEGLVGRLAAVRIARDEIELLRGIVRRMHQAQRESDAEQYFGLNLEFHDLLARAARNNALLANYRGVVNQLDLYRRATITRVAGHIAPSTDEHEAIVAAVAAGDTGRAERLLVAHVLASRSRLTAALAAPTPNAPAHGHPRRRAARPADEPTPR